jgi:hypothetical protein
MPNVPSLKPIQTGFTCHAWRSPDTSYKVIFPKLDLTCELDAAPGIVIVATPDCRSATASEVMNLRAELPKLLTKSQNPAVYWLRCPKQHERSELLSGLTEHPVFFG